MQKTKEITFEGASATISADYAPKKVSVKVISPNISELFESMNEQDIKDHVKTGYSPSDIFDEKQLMDWANEHGYIKE